MALTTFGARLKELREAAGMTQAELAARADLGNNVLGRLERGAHEPTWPNVLKLAAALGVTCEAFSQEPTTPQTPSKKGRPRKVQPTAEMTEQPAVENLAANVKKPRKKS